LQSSGLTHAETRCDAPTTNKEATMGNEKVVTAKKALSHPVPRTL